MSPAGSTRLLLYLNGFLQRQQVLERLRIDKSLAQQRSLIGEEYMYESLFKTVKKHSPELSLDSEADSTRPGV
jgi:hypothetical protein